MPQTFGPEIEEIADLERRLEAWLNQGADLRRSCERLRQHLEKLETQSPDHLQSAPVLAPSVREWRNSLRVPLRVARRGRPVRASSDLAARTQSAH